MVFDFDPALMVATPLVLSLRRPLVLRAMPVPSPPNPHRPGPELLVPNTPAFEELDP